MEETLEQELQNRFERLKEELPDIYEEYSKVGKPYSSFTFKVTE